MSFDFKSATPSTTQLVAGNFLMGAASQAAATPTLYDAKVLPLISGNFTATLTITGNTNVTLPTSGTVTALGNASTGSGSVVLATSPTLVTPLLGTPTSGVATNLTGLPLTTGVTGLLPGANGGTGVANTGFTLTLAGTSSLPILTNPSGAILQLGAADAASPVAQTLQAQSVVAGTSSTAGVSATFIGSLSTGTAAAGTRILQTGFANVTQSAVSVTCTSASPCVVTLTAHGLVPGAPFQFGGTTAPTGTALNTTYYVLASGLAANTFQFALTLANWVAGTAANTSSTGTAVTLTTQATVQNPASTIVTWGPSGLTGSQSTGLLALAATWSTSGTPAALDLNVVDIASNASSLLFNFRKSGTSQGKLDKSGNLTITGNLTVGNADSILFSGTPVKITNSSGTDLGFQTNNANRIYINSSGNIGFGISNPSQVITVISTGAMAFDNGSGTADTLLTRPAAATFQFGAADATSPVAQLQTMQSVVAGTTNTAGVNRTVRASAGTGTGAGGQHIWQTAPAGSTGSSQNAFATGLTITAPAVNMQPSVVVGNQALATTATDGFLYIPTCAGTPTGVPTSSTGRIPMVYDTTNHQFWFYDSGWKQPKTPAAAATVTWQ